MTSEAHGSEALAGAPAPAGIDVHGVRYGSEDAGRRLSGVNLAAPLGALVAVVGASGAGKTTLLEVLAGLLPPAAGTV